MKTKIQTQVLSIEQMQKLKELGVDTSKASMCWQSGSATRHKYILSAFGYMHTHLKEGIYTFTLQDILEILPSVIDDNVDTYRLSISKLGNGDWFVSMFNNGNSKYLFDDWTRDKSLLIAAYEMLVMIAENGYLKGDTQ